MFKSRPNLADAWYNRGMILHEIGNSDEAKANFEQALKIEPNSNTTWSYPLNQPITVELLSERGVGYTQLRNLLALGKWKEADQKTQRLMLEASGRLGKDPSGSNTQYSWLKNIPCADLKTIDRLWVEYSNARFGFSVQKEKWLKLGGDEHGWQEWQIGTELGWTYYYGWNLHFSLDAPVGHLPVANIGNVGKPGAGSYLNNPNHNREWFLGEFFALWQRLIECSM